MHPKEDDTFIGDTPFFPPGQAATPGDSMRLIALGGPQVEQCIALTGQDRFEHLLLYCLTLLNKASRGGICAFYLSDFEDCDEVTLKVIQRLINRSGYVTSPHLVGPAKQYQGFWAWRPTDAAPAAPPPQAAPPKTPAPVALPAKISQTTVLTAPPCPPPLPPM
jgi:hypothetical protein